MSVYRFSLLVVGITLAVCAVRAEPTVLGVVYKDKPISFDLDFINHGKSPVTLGKVQVSCDCLTVVDKPSTVAAGATAKIACRYQSAKSGRLDVDMIVQGAAGSPPLATYKITGWVADKTLLLSPAEVFHDLAKIAVVDTRESARFAEVHMPRAWNVPIFALKTRVDLRTREVVLVDEGFDPARMLEEAAALRAQGFAKVFVLDGGLPAWLRKNLPVEGRNTVAGASLVAAISPADFLRARLTGVWQVVGVGILPTAQMKGLLSLHITSAKRGEDVGGLLAALPPAHDGRARARILVISADGSSPELIETHLPKHTDMPVYYLQGGLAALAHYQAEQIAMAENTGQRLQVKPVYRTPFVTGACGSCGK